MLVFSGGHKIAGTVGGGAVEAGMIDEAASMLGQPNTRIRRFKLGESPDDEKGICGGSIEFLIESFDRSALPLFRWVLTLENPSFSSSARRSAIGTLVFPPTLIPRSSAT
jgi:xanthine/CO dehydrogenase XdhC/CoxF family maturation factor